MTARKDPKDLLKEGRKPYYDNVEDMQRKIDLYFAACDGEQEAIDELEPTKKELKEIVKENWQDHYTITGLALALGFTSRQGLLNYEDKTEFFDTVKKAKMKVERYIEKKLYGNNATGCIFNLKNNYGWKDTQSFEGQGVPVNIINDIPKKDS